MLVKYKNENKILNFFLFYTYFCSICLSFDYEVETHAKREVIKTFPISANEKYISFILEGTWTDNLGNYGLMEQASFVLLKNDNVIELDGYGKKYTKMMKKLISEGIETVKSRMLE